MLATKTPKMNMAVSRLKQLSADERTRMLYEARELYVMDEMARIEGALKKGRLEGHREGHLEGHREKAMEIARKMLNRGTEPKIIAEDTGLSVEELDNLRAIDSGSGRL
ncbi:hypothetical protein AGMMS50276_09940 [Synergistales bacterium]|nr:hypothetical protein AGMMS50276_09940 [Synergistales bacterium]